MKTNRSCVALLSVLAITVPAAAKDVLINSKWTSIPSDPLPKDIKTIRVQKPTYEYRGNDDGFMGVNIGTRFEGLPYWYSAFWGYYGYGGHARNQRIEDDKFYRFVIGELERLLRKERPDIRLTDIEDRMIRDDARDDARARGRNDAHAMNREALHDATIVVRFSLDVRDESKVEHDKLHERVGRAVPARVALCAEGSRFIGGTIPVLGCNAKWLTAITSWETGVTKSGATAMRITARRARAIRRASQRRSQNHEGLGVSELFLAPPSESRVVLAARDMRLKLYLLGYPVVAVSPQTCAA